MIAIPSIAMVSLIAMLSMLGAVILRKPWMKFTALGLAAVEVGLVIFLVIVARG